MNKTEAGTPRARTVELVAPAGNWAMLQAALDSGADAVYFGVTGFNMRATARNFESDELPAIAECCHQAGRRCFLALNTLVYEEELQRVGDLLDWAARAEVDAVICWDPAVIQAVNARGLPLHISTQASIANSDAARFYQDIGARRCVPARECTLTQIEAIAHGSDLEVEVFAHGAMCVSVSGRCFISQFLDGRSANRGDCLQPCRRAYDAYLIRDREEQHELILGKDFVLSPKDLCTLPFLDQLLPHVNGLKIEGRARSPEYVAVVVSVYREALTAIQSDSFDEAFIEDALSRLRTVYNRGFSTGFYMGRPVGDFSTRSGSQAERRKATLGIITNYYQKVGVAEVLVSANQLRTGDEIVVIGPTTGVVQQTVESMEIDHQAVDSVSKGQRVGVKIGHSVRRNDQVYLWQEASR